MKILAVTSIAVPMCPAGPEITLHELLRRLAERAHDVEVKVEQTPFDNYLEGGIRYSKVKNDEELEDLARGADVVLTQLHAVPRASRVAKKADTPLVELRHFLAPVLEGVERGDLLVACSEACHASLGAAEEGAVVVRPQIRVADYRLETAERKKPEERRLLCLGFSKDKGADKLVELAAAMPLERFLAVRGIYGEQLPDPGLPNLEVVNPTPRAKKLYKEAKAVLVLSPHESWSRAAVEAACSGIPTIGADGPGLIESMGDARVRVSESATVDDWANAITSLSDTTVYADLSHIAEKRARHLEHLVAADVELLENAISGRFSTGPRKATAQVPREIPRPSGLDASPKRTAPAQATQTSQGAAGSSEDKRPVTTVRVPPRHDKPKETTRLRPGRTEVSATTVGKQKPAKDEKRSWAAKGRRGRGPEVEATVVSRPRPSELQSSSKDKPRRREVKATTLS